MKSADMAEAVESFSKIFSSQVQFGIYDLSILESIDDLDSEEILRSVYLQASIVALATLDAIVKGYLIPSDSISIAFVARSMIVVAGAEKQGFLSIIERADFLKKNPGSLNEKIEKIEGELKQILGGKLEEAERPVAKIIPFPGNKTFH